jgi:hypothetical protein
MVKLNSVIFNKLMAQADEAQTRGLTKLASDIKQAIGTEPASELSEYSYVQLRDDIRQDIWKAAAKLITYYNMESVDADKLQHAILHVTAQVMDDLEHSLQVDEIAVGPLEPSVPGEVK